MEVALDERRSDDREHLVEPRSELAEGGRIVGAGERSDLGDHLLAVVAGVQHRAVGERRPVHRVEWLDLHVAVDLGTGGRERRAQQLGHRDHRRSGVDVESGFGEHAGPPARRRFALQDRDVVAAADEVGGGRQPAQPGTDDDDAHVRPRAG